MELTKTRVVYNKDENKVLAEKRKKWRAKNMEREREKKDDLFRRENMHC